LVSYVSNVRAAARDTAAVVRRRVIVHGRVQGVGFRYFVADAARSRGLTGWVQNRPDGLLEAVFEGEADAVEALVRHCEDGPRGAIVTHLVGSDEEPEGLGSFEIR
jgi:acylphosphatase